MRQAILITAYKNFDHLKEIIDFFDHNFRVYIHIDKKVKVPKKQLLDLKSNPIVSLVSQRYKVNWGGLNHLRAILHLSQEALNNPTNLYFHLISGHDFPIKSLEDFVPFLNQNKDSDFLDYFSVPKKGWADNNGMDRLEYFNLYDYLNAKNLEQNGWIRRIVRFQKWIGYKRKLSSNMPKLYAGSTWWSLSRPSLNHVVNYTKQNKILLNRFKHTLCAEEFFFQTVLLNSPFSKRIKNDNLRHIDWVARNGNNPAVLDLSDLADLKKSNAYFARKFDYPTSTALLEMVKKDILGDERDK
ncbi:beta-1,6-N-acetylglucosaminyltransferase [Salinimicrobium oceani]|uniref:Peptide O-xylosyltransferase n=1 Tax=Salinimicrobium oceani TaxID=2722702 RepID=A0ABX1D059_9FLAO|nr:beta-1,6-N-acetylglucosaminyltransferase [Salinimicrobium oceani]NJW53655.1 beta-1,6-N-acetylglucosaminyltransferase [Salinimicrobium oceani]